MLSIGSCPYGRSWADKAIDYNTAHQESECSNAGICNRDTGNCMCYNGYSGNACQRSK